MRLRTRSSLTGCIIFLFLFLVISCKKQSPQQNLETLPAAQGTPAELSIDFNHPSYLIPSDYLGLSFEMTAIADSNYFNVDNLSFVRLIQNLGTGIIRIGANGVDVMHWSGQARKPSTTKYSIATTDMDRFSAFIHAVGWQTIVGLNFGSDFNPVIAGNEAKYVARSLGDLLYSFEVGNEADIYPTNGFRKSNYSVNDFNGEWEQYYYSVISASPGSALTGPAFAYNRSWLSSFAKQENSRVKKLTIHFYQAGPATDPSININTILAPKADTAINVFARAVKSIAGGAGLQYRISECNSIYDGGKNDVSNSFASALWAIDFMYLMAYQGCTGINFHGGNNGPYTPIGLSAGEFFAKPEYYAMLFFKNAAIGNLLPCKLNVSNENVSAYASQTADGKLYVSIVNKEPATQVAVTVQTGTAAFHSVSLASLTAASLTATEGISFQGNTIQPDGGLSVSQVKQYSVVSSEVTINVGAASAMLLVFSPS